MAKQKGRTMLIKIGDGAEVGEVFATLCGLRTKTMTVNNNEYDVTTADCANPGGALWTEVQGGAKRLSLSGNGFFKTATDEQRLNAVAMLPDPIANFEVIVPGLGTFAGAFIVSSVEYGGEQEGGVTYGMSLASTGAVTFTVAA